MVRLHQFRAVNRSRTVSRDRHRDGDRGPRPAGRFKGLERPHHQWRRPLVPRRSRHGHLSGRENPWQRPQSCRNIQDAFTQFQREAQFHAAQAAASAVPGDRRSIWESAARRNRGKRGEWRIHARRVRFLRSGCEPKEQAAQCTAIHRQRDPSDRKRQSLADRLRALL